MAEAIRLQEAVSGYLIRREKQTARSTFVNDRSLFLRFQKFIGGNPYMVSITADQVWDFFYSGSENALSSTLAETTFNLAYGRMGHFIRYCEKRGLVRTLLLDGITYKQVPEQNQRRFTATELVHLCTATKQPQERILIALACNTALRISDITSLRLSTRDAKGVLLPETPTLDLDQGWLHVRISKTGKCDSLPITTELDTELRAWLTHYATVYGKPLEPDMLLVPSKVGSYWGSDFDFQYRPYTQITTVESKYRRAVQDAGLPFTKGNGFHTLRRSFARVFYEELKRLGHPDPIRPVQASLHHAKPEMTYHYIGVALDREFRNEVLRSKTFLTRLAADTTNVTQLRPLEGHAHA